METTRVPERACGFRESGAAYLVVRTGPGGSPIDRFLLCPPVRADAARLGLSPLGVTLIERDGRTNVWDIVGGESYPNAADWIEEARLYGVSRRIAKTVDFSRLGAGSRLIVLHARGYIENFDDYYRFRPDDEWFCPRDVPRHLRPARTEKDRNEMCSSLFYESVEGGEPSGDPLTVGGALTRGGDDMTGMHMHRRRSDPRAVVRTLPSLSYRAFRSPDDVVPIWSLAIIASLPIGHIDVILDRNGESHIDTMARAMKSGLDVNLCEE